MSRRQAESSHPGRRSLCWIGDRHRRTIHLPSTGAARDNLSDRDPRQRRGLPCTPARLVHRWRTAPDQHGHRPGYLRPSHQPSDQPHPAGRCPPGGAHRAQRPAGLRNRGLERPSASVSCCASPVWSRPKMNSWRNWKPSTRASRSTWHAPWKSAPRSTTCATWRAGRPRSRARPSTCRSRCPPGHA